VETVHILAIIDRAENLVLPDVLGQRRLDENALSLSISASNSACGVFSSSTMVSEWMPSSSAFAPFMRT
jgi:hypothetical protein